jgi:hypothetical protein
MNFETFLVFRKSAIMGAIIWCLSGGTVHAYIICVDWKAMEGLTVVVTQQQIALVILAGLMLGLAAETGKFIGALFESELATLLLPGIAGAIIGGLQGLFIGYDYLNQNGTFIFRPENVRILSGAILGFIISYPVVIGGMMSRQGGRRY